MQSQAFPEVTPSVMQILPLGKKDDPNECLAKVSVIIQPDEQGGWVTFQGVEWRAQSTVDFNLEVGKLVRIIDRQKLTLIVEPIRYQDYFKLTANPRLVRSYSTP
jgi:membrane-bound ClpP family serine protease